MTWPAAEKAYELGKKYELEYRGCSQCAVAALQDALNIQNDAVFKSATGLAAGGGQTIDGSCGAYVGAIMVLGTVLGRERNNFADPEKVRNQTHALVRRFRENYIREYGSVVCRNIQTKLYGRAFYLVDPDDRRKFEEAGCHGENGCPQVVGKAARWMAEVMLGAGLLEGKK